MDHASILIAGYEPDLLHHISTTLQKGGYVTKIASSENDALVQIVLFQPDVIIVNLDAKNSNKDGFDLCMKMRKRTLCPIITLSVHNDDENWIRALTYCADNYIVKPFTDEWLLAVVNASLRLWLTHKLGRQLPNNVIKSGALFIDPDLHRVMIRGEQVLLTPTEFDILLYLAKNDGRVISYEELILAVWKTGRRDPVLLRGFISQIRKKIEANPANPEFIITVPGCGYRFIAKSVVQEKFPEE